MTYTITFDPSPDRIAACEDFRLGETNRVSGETIFPGEGIGSWSLKRASGMR